MRADLAGTCAYIRHPSWRGEAPLASSNAMAVHDHSYKLLFSHPQMVRDLMEGFVGGEWLEAVDFDTLERVSGSYMSDDLRARADDIVWRVRCGEGYVYLLIEFQSSVDRYMAVRVLTYVGLLYQDVIRERELLSPGCLPAVLPIVVYNGSRRWHAAQEFTLLLYESFGGLENYRASLRYRLIDEGAYDDDELARHAQDCNRVALLFQLENCLQYDRVEALVTRLVESLRGAGQDGLRRAFAVWLDKVILARLSREGVVTANELWEKQTMLSERFDVWEEELRQAGRQEGRQEGESMLLLRLLKKRFGDVPDTVLGRLHAAKSDELEYWAERLLEAASLNDLFGGELQ
jgi:predicted transposase/invertase (TIGR01784 family)